MHSVVTRSFIVGMVAVGATAVSSFGGITFMSLARTLVIDADPDTQGCEQALSSQAAGLFAALLPSGCDGGITAAQQDSVIVPAPFVGGSAFARHAFGPTVYSSRSSIEVAFGVDCVATLAIGGQLQVASSPDAVARVRIVDSRGVAVYLSEAVAADRGDVFVTLDDVAPLSAGQYHLTIEAVADAIDMPGPDVAFAALTIACVFTDGNTSCPGDLNADGVVDGTDLGLLLASWRAVGSCDVDGDGMVASSDLEALLDAWGPCRAANDGPR